jgi:hypothetical protein
MSPLPTVVDVTLVVGGVPEATPVLAPGKVLITTLLVTRRADNVAPEISPLAPIVKSTGSIVQ